MFCTNLPIIALLGTHNIVWQSQTLAKANESHVAHEVPLFPTGSVFQGRRALMKQKVLV